MTRPVLFDDQAEIEYRLAGRYYERIRDHLGLEFLDAIDATVERIRERPEAGTLVRGIAPEFRVRHRAVARFPYRVVYIEIAGGIRILAIAHDRRKPGYWSDRLARR